MANETLYASLADSRVSEVLGRAFLLSLADRAALQQHPALIYVGDCLDSGSLTKKTSEINWSGAVQLASTADGSTVANTVITDAAHTVTVGSYRKSYAPSDLARLTDPFGQLDPMSFAQDGVASGAMTLTNLIAQLGAGFSQSVGSTGVNMTVQNFYDAAILLELGNVVGPYLLILHGRQFADFRDALRGETGALEHMAETQALATDLRGVGYKGQWSGVDIQVSNQVPTINAAADRSGFMIGRGAVLWADGTPKADPAVVGNTFGKIRVEFDRIPAQNVTLAVTSMNLGVAEGIDLAGVEVVSDA